MGPGGIRLHAWRRGRGPLIRRTRQRALRAESVIVDPNFDWRGEYLRRSVPWERTIIYEMHVKKITQLHPKVDERLKGFYAGLGSKPIVDYIKSLGVTTVELMPIHPFVDDSNLLKRT